MIANRNKFLLGVMAGLLALASCNPMNKMTQRLSKTTYSMDPKVLEVQGDSVLISFKINIPAKALHKRGIIKFEPVLKYGNDEQVLKSLTVTGPDADESGAQIIDVTKGGSVTYSDRVLYNPQMKKCMVLVQPNLKIKNKEEILDQCFDMKRDTLGLGTITTALSYKSDEDLSLKEDAKIINPTVDKNSILYYIIDTWDFRPDYKVDKIGMNNRKEINSLVKFLQEKTAYKVVGIKVKSFASPDGRFGRNILLARNRTVTASNYVKKEMRRQKFTEVNDENFFTKSSITEDISGWVEAVTASKFADKKQILDILNDNSKSEDEKEALVKKNHNKSYTFMKQQILPKLRRSIISVVGELPVKTLESIIAKGNMNLDSLDFNDELVYVQNLKEINDKEKVYRHMTTKYPGEWIGYNNLAAIYIKNKKYADAKPLLEKALSLNPNAGEVYNNLGIVYKNMKMYDKAEENYKMAKSKGMNEGNNLGILSLKRGNYNDAISYFKGANATCQYNLGLAYTLVGEYDNAQKTLDCIESNKKDASVYYLKAIAASRAGKLSDLTTYLTKAIQLDPSYKQTAMDDLEFLKYRNSTEFKNVVK